MPNNGFKEEQICADKLSELLNIKFDLVGSQGNKADLISTNNQYIISVKSFKGKTGSNQITRLWVQKLQDDLNFSDQFIQIIEEFCYKPRILFNQRTEQDKNLIITELENHKKDLLNYIFNKNNNLTHIALYSKDKDELVLVPYQDFLNNYLLLKFKPSIKGNYPSLGVISMQRKGGDNGKHSANQLQFKFSPGKAFDYFAG